MKNFTINNMKFKAEDCIENILINPVLPKNFDVTPNNERPKSHEKFYYMAYVEFETVEKLDKMYKLRGGEIEEKWQKEWRNNFLKQGAKTYRVYCLDGGAWDRPTGCGQFNTLQEAINCAKERKERYK